MNTKTNIHPETDINSGGGGNRLGFQFFFVPPFCFGPYATEQLPIYEVYRLVVGVNPEMACFSPIATSMSTKHTTPTSTPRPHPHH
jgi:hypothetical protein